MSQHFASLKPGDVVEVKGPIEKLRYTPNMKKHIGMIAGGSGITPMLQVIEAVLKNPDDKTQISLLYANVSPDDILLKQKLDVLAASHPNLKVFYTVDNPTKNWRGGAGYISKDVVVKGLPSPSDDALILVCGPPGMMKHISGEKAKDWTQGELSGILKEAGYTEEMGVECEYRHNEVVRLNPRDCWYWLYGTCLNPTCAFRHPPLDGHTGIPSEPTQSPLPTSKAAVPCYYFFNGFCIKGERCSFLHTPDDSFYNLKCMKNDNGSTDALILDNKTSSANKTGVASTPTETYSDPALTALSRFKVPHEENLQLSLPKNVKPQDDCLGISSFEHKEATVTRSDSLSRGEGFVHRVSHFCSDQCSDEQVNCHREPEERWESSPGFDVLVHDGLENLGYEDDSEYLPVLDREHQELDEQYLGCEFKSPDECDTILPGADIMYGQETYDGYRCLDRDLIHVDDRKVCAYSREIFLDSILSRKRIHMLTDRANCGRDMDLRDHLRRRKEINVPPATGFLRRYESSFVVRSQKRQRGYGIDQQQSRRRLTSQLGFSTVESIGEVETLSAAKRRRLFRHSKQQHWPREQYREKLAKEHFVSSMKPVLKQRNSIHESTTFSGPKTLAEIKEEKKKRKTEESLHCRSTLADFKDPKPLSEILKDRRNIDQVRDGNTCSN
ncbi:unnamed protein product [Lupinus luteus]|uniref:C3H1-type domain-containing protein n=1 Tax=Lupinus luteus TaxID=3873 RepID=A0AAV1XVM4_LUPLU